MTGRHVKNAQISQVKKNTHGKKGHFHFDTLRKGFQLIFPLLQKSKLKPSFPLLLTVPGYHWSAGPGLCDTSSDTHTAHLYPEPWQCEQAETQNKLPKPLSTELTVSPGRHCTEEFSDFHTTELQGTRYSHAWGREVADPGTGTAHEHRFQNCFKAVTQPLTVFLEVD